MAKIQAAPLDEIQFRRPEVLEYWGGVHADSVHGYIRESPFFDHTSKNGLLWDQAYENGQIFEVCRRRDLLEARLKLMGNGLEFMIVGEPQPSPDPALGPDTGVWIIRKQERKKRQGREDEITVLGTYYLVGENMYQAPSVYDIVGNHLLSAMTSLSKFMDQATPLPIFTPAVGYSYHPPANQKVSTHPSQTLSREGSPTAAHSQRSTSIDPGTRAPSVIGSINQSSTAALDPRDSLALEQSLRLMSAFGDEYMDENPLRGEPGSFVYTHTRDRLRAKQVAADSAAAKAKAKEKEEADSKSKSATPAAFSTSPDKVKTENAADGTKLAPVRKGSKAESKAKKRKSRIPTAPGSPIGGTPVAGRSPAATG